MFLGRGGALLGRGTAGGFLLSAPAAVVALGDLRGLAFGRGAPVVVIDFFIRLSGIRAFAAGLVRRLGGGRRGAFARLGRGRAGGFMIIRAGRTAIVIGRGRRGSCAGAGQGLVRRREVGAGGAGVGAGGAEGKMEGDNLTAGAGQKPIRVGRGLAQELAESQSQRSGRRRACILVPVLEGWSGRGRHGGGIEIPGLDVEVFH